MLFTPIVYQNIISGIIAPHGMTDLFHSQQYNKTKELLLMNAGITITSFILNNNDLSPILDSSFFLSSIVHFRHDMPNIKMIPRYFLSTSLILLSLQQPDLFFLYMIALHVPNHYKNNWKYIEYDKDKNIGILFLFTVIFLYITNQYNDLIDVNFISTLSKSGIISHIVYEETSIHKD